MPSGYLLDTNLVSEARKPRPNPGVLAFLLETSPDRSFVSAMTIGELRKGVAARRALDAEAADRLAEWVDQWNPSFQSALSRLTGRLPEYGVNCRRGGPSPLSTR